MCISGQNKERVLLIFSVNESKAFQGFARMLSPTGTKEAASWVAREDGTNNEWGGGFAVEWLAMHDLPFTQVEHLHNPLNEDLPVKISRDGQVI